MSVLNIVSRNVFQILELMPLEFSTETCTYPGNTNTRGEKKLWEPGGKAIPRQPEGRVQLTFSVSDWSTLSTASACPKAACVVGNASDFFKFWLNNHNNRFAHLHKNIRCHSPAASAYQEIKSHCRCEKPRPDEMPWRRASALIKIIDIGTWGNYIPENSWRARPCAWQNSSPVSQECLFQAEIIFKKKKKKKKKGRKRQKRSGGAQREKEGGGRKGGGRKERRILSKTREFCLSFIIITRYLPIL